MVWERRISRAVGAHAPGEHLDDGGTLGRGRSLVYGNGDQRRAELGSSGTPRAGGIHRTWDLVSEREISQIWIGALAGAGVSMDAHRVGFVGVKSALWMDDIMVYGLGEYGVGNGVCSSLHPEDKTSGWTGFSSPGHLSWGL